MSWSSAPRTRTISSDLIFSGKFKRAATTKSLSIADVELGVKKEPLAVYCLLRIFPRAPKRVNAEDPELISLTVN